MIQKIQTSRVFKRILQAEKDGFNVILLQGGSRSTKTWSSFQFFQSKAIQGEKFNVTITREHLQLIKDTLLEDLKEMRDKYKLEITPEININRPSQNYKLRGGEFVFWGLDKPKKAHGKKQTYTWMNEVMEIPNKSVFDQMEMRTEKLMVIDYNPSDDQHWVFSLLKRPDVILIKSTMLDNPFLPKKIKDKILGYEPTAENIKNGTADNYMWEVYGLGNAAKLEGAVFTNWDVVDSIPDNAKDLGLGLDFGYTNDPTVLVDVYLMDQELYLNERIYERGLMNVSPDESADTISKRMRQLEIGYREITADSSEPKSISELANDGWQIFPADKGPDSINYGIDLMKGYKIHITRNSIGLQGEFRKYKWAQDKNGNSLNKPIDAFNHGIDASRYRISRVLGGWTDTQLHPMNVLG